MHIHMIKVAGTVLTAGAALGLAAAPASATPSLGYEVDNGTSWTLSTNPSSLSASGAGASYGDAGVVVDIGPAADFAGITPQGSASLQDNIWIGDGSEAYTSGTHPLSAGVDFSYGFDNRDGTFWMASGPHAGETLTVDQIKSDFTGHEVYAWVGVVSTGASVAGSVTSVNGVSTGHRTMSVTAQNGTLTETVK